MKVGDIVSLKSEFSLSNGENIAAGTWGDVAFDTAQNGLTIVKFRNRSDIVSIGVNHLQLETETAAQPTPKPDMINNPPHYQSDTGVECIDAIRAMLGREGFIAFLRGTILAYEWRLGRKDDPKLELGKIGWYQERLRKVLLDE